jgi:hypothetical protein
MPSLATRLVHHRWNVHHKMASARLLVNLTNVFQTSILVRPACDKNMGVGLRFNRATEASGRFHQQSPIHLNARNRGTTFRAKTLERDRGRFVKAALTWLTRELAFDLPRASTPREIGKLGYRV